VKSINAEYCGNFDSNASPTLQNIQKCMNNAERFEDEAKEKYELLENEMRNNVKCKYLRAIWDGNDSEISVELKDLAEQLSNMDDPIDSLTWLNKQPEQSYINVCLEIEELNSCLIDGMLPIVADFEKTVQEDECCAAAIESLTIEGYSIVERIELIIEEIPKLFCLDRIPDDNVQEKQNCGYTIIQSMFPPAYDDILDNLKTLVQIPNDQVCKAFNGEIFYDTNGRKSFLTINLPIGSCSSAFDTIFSTMRAFFLDESEDNSLKDVITELIGDDFYNYIENEIGPLSDLFNDDGCSVIELPEGLGSICVNLPTYFSFECYPSLEEQGVMTGPWNGLFSPRDPSDPSDSNDESNMGSVFEIGFFSCLLIITATTLSFL